MVELEVVPESSPSDKKNTSQNEIPKRYFSFIGEDFDLTSHYHETRSDNFIIAYTNKYDLRRRLNYLNGMKNFKIVELKDANEVGWFMFDHVREENLDITKYMPIACLDKFTIIDYNDSLDVENNEVTFTNPLGEKRVEIWESNLVKKSFTFHANGTKTGEYVYTYNDKLQFDRTYFAKWTPYDVLKAIESPDKHLECYDNGVIKNVYGKLNGLKHGKLISRHRNGNLSFVATYENGVLNGMCYKINHNNTVVNQTLYVNGVMQKMELSFNEPQEAAKEDPAPTEPVSVSHTTA